MFQPQHCGLIFTEHHIRQAQANRRREPHAAAWDRLTTEQHDEPADALIALQRDCWRYRFAEDAVAGERAIAKFVALDYPMGEKPTHEVAADTWVMAQCFEMLRDHSQFVSQQARFLDAFFEVVATVNQRDAEPPLLDALWLAVLNTTAGIILEREPIFQQGVGVFRQIIDEKVHPEGYLPEVVEIGVEVVSLEEQLLCAKGLALIAEMAMHVGVDLWGHQQRGVSALTAVTYPLYYYFYPEKWPWNGDQWKPSDGVEMETAQGLFRKHGAFLEIAGLRYASPLKAIQMILDDLRPAYDPYAGGLLTLSHAVPQRKRFGLFG